MLGNAHVLDHPQKQVSCRSWVGARAAAIAQRVLLQLVEGQHQAPAPMMAVLAAVHRHTCLRMAAANSTGSVGLASLGLSRGLSGVGLASGMGLTACAAVGVCCCWPASSVRGTRTGATSAAMLLVCDEHGNEPRAHRERERERPDSLRHPPNHAQTAAARPGSQWLACCAACWLLQAPTSHQKGHHYAMGCAAARSGR